MNNILLWEPEKSRMWSNAKIENIHHLREDLATLAEWIRAKAEIATLSSKADVAKVNELEKALEGFRGTLESYREQSGMVTQEITRKVETLEAFAQSSQDALVQCRRIEESVRELESIAREASARTQAELREQAGAVTQDLENVRTAAAECQAFKEECQQARESTRGQVDQFVALWEQARQTLENLSRGVEQNAGQVDQLTRTAREVLAECQTKAGECRELHSTLEAQQADANEHIADLLRQAETQASTAVENARLTVASSQLASSLKAECEGLLQTLHLKSEELSSTWQTMERDFSELSGTTRQSASDVAASVRSAQDVLAECQSLAQSHQEWAGRLQAREEELRVQQQRLEEMLAAAVGQVTTSGNNLQACQTLQAQIAEVDARLSGLARRLEDRAQSDDGARSEFQRRTATFAGRLKWLLSGGSPP